MPLLVFPGDVISLRRVKKKVILKIFPTINQQLGLVLELLSSVAKKIQHETTSLDLNEISLKYYSEEMCQYKVFLGLCQVLKNGGYNITPNQTILV